MSKPKNGPIEGDHNQNAKNHGVVDNDHDNIQHSSQKSVEFKTESSSVKEEKKEEAPVHTPPVAHQTKAPETQKVVKAERLTDEITGLIDVKITKNSVQKFRGQMTVQKLIDELKDPNAKAFISNQKIANVIIKENPRLGPRLIVRS